MSLLGLIQAPWRILALLLLAAALAGFGFVKGAQYGERRLDAYKSAQDRAHIEDLNRAAAKTRAWQQAKDEALNAATKRAQANAKAAAAARRTADGLRDDLAAARGRLPDASSDAVRKYGEAVNSILGECAAEVERLAGEAQSISSDALKLKDAWPQ